MAYLRGIFYSLPVQLLFLHFRKYQALLLFWFILFATVNGTFMKNFGADALFLAPEYLGNVNFLSAALLGIAIGVFVMFWNIATFILFSRHFTFLAATQYPFFKYCINNSVIPLTFLLFFLIKAYQFAHYKELISNLEIIFLAIGFLTGLIFTLTICFIYFFRADKSILRKMQPVFNDAKSYIAQLQPAHKSLKDTSLIRSEWFLDSFWRIRRCRDVSHYSAELMEKIFKRHHFAAVVCVLLAYVFLIVIGFFLDYKVFQIPAAASITILFAILIGVAGAFAYFLQTWSVPVLVLFILLLNFLYKLNWIDPTNKAYGLNYVTETNRPAYSAQALQNLSSTKNIEQDKQNMSAILNRWKQKQEDEKPILVLMATSGGGTRSAAFTMNVLQQLDSITSGQIMKKMFLITGASGGMIGATYFRELYRQKLLKKNINLQDKKFVDDISQDLLNATFSSFVARDLFAPEQRFSVGPFKYLRDRGYAFETALNDNTRGLLNKRLQDYVVDEAAANIPLILYHSVITRDGKKLMIGTQPMRFMMQTPADTVLSNTTSPDGIDFVTFFAQQSPYNLRVLTALRMNATFPVVLPNVWLPSKPVIDVMDGGLRDNYGIENTLRFLAAMQTWIEQNTSGVLIIQVRDRSAGGWEAPFEFEGITQNAVKPFFLLENNWYKIMEYMQNDLLNYFSTASGYPIHKVLFQYASNNEENKAALNFHLTQREKRDVALSLKAKSNYDNLIRVAQLLKPQVPKAP
ncbi:MAG: patatin-like phospholipase family protein [Chitinophagaceae bacterium]